MKEKNRSINLKVSNITPKQWSSLVIELNLIADAWKPYGPTIKLKTHNFDRIIKWGRNTNENTSKDRRSRSTLGSNERSEI